MTTSLSHRSISFSKPVKPIPNPNAGEPYEKPFIQAPNSQSETYSGYNDGQGQVAFRPSPVKAKPKAQEAPAIASNTRASRPDKPTAEIEQNNSELVPNPMAGQPHQPKYLWVKPESSTSKYQGYA